MNFWSEKNKTTDCLFLIFANANTNANVFFLMFEHANANIRAITNTHQGLVPQAKSLLANFVFYDPFTSKVNALYISFSSQRRRANATMDVFSAHLSLPVYWHQKTIKSVAVGPKCDTLQ